jgi:subtilisin family serine protease
MSEINQKQVRDPEYFEDALVNRKLHPKLRMILNGSEKVNTVRAERCASLIVEDEKLLQDIPTQRGPLDIPKDPGILTREDVSKKPESIRATVIIRLSDARVELPENISNYKSSRSNEIVIAEVPLNKIEEIKDLPQVTEISIGDNLTFSPPINLKVLKNSDDQIANGLVKLRKVPQEDIHRYGEGVIVGIIDVQGFDFAHPEFIDDNGKTRFLKIWDQGGNTRHGPNQFNYGAEITKKHMDDAISASQDLQLAPTSLEPQSQMALSSHATHVASIAAGTHGVAPKAMLIGVSLALATEDLDRRRNFFDSTRLIHAVDYILQEAEKIDPVKNTPIVINISLGTNGHAHDGTSAIGQWIDTKFSQPGRCVCVAAGNAGQEDPVTPGDANFLMGRIHTSGVIPSAGLTKHIQWVVAGGGIADLSENELEIWYSMQDKFAISLRPPDSKEWIGPVQPGQFIENKKLDNETFVSIYNERYTPANGDNYIACYLSPKMGGDSTAGVKAGIWTVMLHALEVRNGEFHGWIERDDPRRYGRLGTSQGWAFPSFFAKSSNVDQSSVSSLGCTRRIITVGNLDEDNEMVHVSSSQGPTRDGRQKPEILAPGSNIVAANGFAFSDEKYVAMTGTSMASPYVAGVAALMLAVQPGLTTSQIAGIMRRTAKPLPGTDYNWTDDAGFGKINPEACIREAQKMNERIDITHQ